MINDQLTRCLTVNEEIDIVVLHIKLGQWPISRKILLNIPIIVNYIIFTLVIRIGQIKLYLWPTLSGNSLFKKWILNGCSKCCGAMSHTNLFWIRRLSSVGSVGCSTQDVRNWWPGLFSNEMVWVSSLLSLDPIWIGRSWIDSLIHATLSSYKYSDAPSRNDEGNDGLSRWSRLKTEFKLELSFSIWLFND